MITVTDLTSYMYCSRKLYFSKVLKVRERPQEMTIKGKIKHEVFENASRSEKEILLSFCEKDTQEDLEMKFRSVYYKLLMQFITGKKEDIEAQGMNVLEVYKELWPFFLLEAKNKSKYFFNISTREKVYDEKLWMILPKNIPELRIVSENLQLMGVVDRLELEDGFTPIEIKTGKAPSSGVWKENMIQLGAYMLLLSEHYGKEINEGYVEYRMINERRKVVMNAFLHDEILDLIKRVNELFVSKELPLKTKDEWKCKICGIREVCFSS